MTTNFPTSVDSFPDPLATDRLDNPPHDVLHTNVNSAVEAIETALLDGAPLHIDDANERVGVGTTSPSTELEVDGTVTATEFVGDLQGPTHIRVKNTSGGSLSKGTPVYATGSVGASGAVEVQASLAGTASTMPALGLLDETLADNAQGSATILGVIRQMDTSSYSVNDSLYVAVSGGLTNVRPTGASELVQKIGRVIRADASTGEILVLGAGRTNDVPNGLSPTITLSGDASGSVTLTELSSGTLSVTVNDDSHNHTIANVDNLQSSLDGKAASSHTHPYAASSHTHPYAASSHTHSYAASSHTHSYVPTSGGTVTGNFTAQGNMYIGKNGGGDSYLYFYDDNSNAWREFFWDDSENRFRTSHNMKLSGYLHAGTDLYVGDNGGGDSNAYFYDDNSNTWRTFQWDDSVNGWRVEDNGGTMRTLYHSGNCNNYSTNWTSNRSYADDWFRAKGDSGFYFEDKGTGIRSPLSEGGQYGSVATYGGEGGWEGFSIGGRVVFMHNMSSNWGIYNDVNNEWMIYGGLNAGVELKYNSTTRMYTDNSGGVTSGRHYVTSNLDVGGMGNFTAHVETDDGIAVFGGENQASINNTYLDHSSIQFATDTYWGGVYTQHTGFMITCGGMSGWNNAELSFRCGNNWGSYNSSSALRLKGDRAYFALGPETTYDVYSDGAGRIGYYGSRREWKNVIGEIDKTAAYSRIMALSPVEYTWKPEHRPDTDNTELIGFNVHRGFIAEDVEAVDRVLAQYGWLYHEGDGDGDKTGQPLTEELSRTDQTLDDAVVVSYDSKAMFADLVAAVQYLAGRVEELEGAM